MMTKRNISRDIRLSLGRSMIEMLGVLAIVGVLSVGGLVAYRQAMIRYKANENIYYLNQVFASALTSEVGTGVSIRKPCSAYADNKDLPYGINCYLSNGDGSIDANISITMEVETTEIAHKMNQFSTAESPYTGNESTYYFFQGMVPFNEYSPMGEPDIEPDRTSKIITASFYTHDTVHENW